MQWACYKKVSAYGSRVGWTLARRIHTNSTVLLKLKDFSRSQAVTYTGKVVISQKQCNIEALLLQII